MSPTTSTPLQHLRDWLHRNAQALQLDRSTVRSPQPNVITARTTDGDLLRVELSVYPRGTL